MKFFQNLIASWVGFAITFQATSCEHVTSSRFYNFKKWTDFSNILAIKFRDFRPFSWMFLHCVLDSIKTQSKPFIFGKKDVQKDELVVLLSGHWSFESHFFLFGNIGPPPAKLDYLYPCIINQAHFWKSLKPYFKSPKRARVWRSSLTSRSYEL